MKIELKKITVKELVEGYVDDGEGGVRGYGGRLDIRPPYQREFVYKDKQREAVIDTVRQGFPLNVMYWADLGDNRFEIIDGQQRTISICQYVKGDFSVGKMMFGNLQADQKESILNYRLTVYACSGADSEKLKWFETINIAGVTLTRQELRNAVYHGPFVSAAKRHFSRQGCPAYGIGNKYLKGSPIRQEYLETAIEWINDGDVEEYLSKHQHDATAKPLWNHFQSVIGWAEKTFPEYRKEMKSVDWGTLYKNHKDDSLDPAKLEKRVVTLMEDEEIQKKTGIYPYLLTGDERHLNLRRFTDKMKREIYEKQKGVCAISKEKLPIEEMDADHIKPWSKGGKTDAANCQLISKKENRRKSDRW